MSKVWNVPPIFFWIKFTRYFIKALRIHVEGFDVHKEILAITVLIGAADFKIKNRLILKSMRQ